MPSTVCCVPLCYSKDIPMFNFPRNITMQNLWLECMGPHNKEVLHLNPKQLRHRRICRLHFEKRFLDGPIKAPKAYPTLFTAEDIARGTVMSSSNKQQSEEHSYCQRNEINVDQILGLAELRRLKEDHSYSMKTVAGRPKTETPKKRKRSFSPCDNEESPSPEINSVNDTKKIVWMDLEMTGLDIDRDQILEVACLISDEDLNVIEAGPNLVIHQPDSVLNAMGQWCQEHHGESGLTKASRESKISLQQAESLLLAFLKKNVPEKVCPLAGNSVYMDRLFIRKYMPKVDQYLHYRIIDVSSFKEVVKRWYPKEYSNIPVKRFSHRGLSDIEDSIEELKYYKSCVFKS